MANKDFDRTVLNARERPLSSDINQAQSQIDRTLRDLLASVLIGRATDTSDLPLAAPISGFFGDAFKVRPTAAPGMSVQLAGGLGFLDNNSDVPSNIGSVSGLDDLSRYKPLYLESPPAAMFSGIPAPTVNPRIDIIEVRMNRSLTNPLSRDVLDIGTGTFVPTLVNKTLAWQQDGSTGTVQDPASSTAAISYKKGIEAASPVAPPTTTGYVKLCEIKLLTSTTTITRGEIKDLRRLLAPYNLMHVSAHFSVPSGAAGATLLQLNAPSGIEIVCRKLIPPTQSYLGFYVVGGTVDSLSKFTGVVTAFNSVLGSDHYPTPVNSAAAVAAGLSSGDVTDLNDATKSGPALLFAQGQPYSLGLAWIVHQINGTTDATLPNPLLVQFHGLLRR